MPSPDVRTRIAEQQAALVAALSMGATAPPDFDAERVQLTARTLRHKRLRTVARTWPKLAEALGEEWFRTTFLEYAQKHPLPSSAMPLADGLAFVRHVAKFRRFPDAAHLEWQMNELSLSRWPVRC